MKCININDTGVPENGAGPITSYPVGILFQFGTPQADITDANALLQDTWQSLLYQTINPNYLLKFDDSAEIGENEQIVANYSEVDVVLGSKQGTDNFKIIADECTIRTLMGNFKTSTEVYGFYTTKDNKFRGKHGTADLTLAPIKFRITANVVKATPESPELVNLSITPDEEYYETVRSARPTWSIGNLISTRNVQLTDNGTSAATFIVDATFCGDCDAASLTVGDFIVHDASGTPVAGTTAVSGYTYTFTPTAPPMASESHTMFLDTPENTDRAFVSNIVTVVIP